MNYAISPVAADTARYLHAINNADTIEQERERRRSDILEELEDGDWEYLEELLTHAPEQQRRDFWGHCLNRLIAGNAAGSSAGMIMPLRDAVEIGIAERIDKEMAKEQEQ